MMPLVDKLKRMTANRWFAVGLLIGAALLLSVVAMNFDEKNLQLAQLNFVTEPIDKLLPVNRIADLSTRLASAPTGAMSKENHPFYTLHFRPPPAPPVAPTPAVPPTPPPPALKKVVMMYQGLYRSAEGREQAFLKVDGKLSILTNGTLVVAPWTVADIGKQKLTLTNLTAETNILEFNREKTLEVPVK